MSNSSPNHYLSIYPPTYYLSSCLLQLIWWPTSDRHVESKYFAYKIGYVVNTHNDWRNLTSEWQEYKVQYCQNAYLILHWLSHANYNAHSQWFENSIYMFWFFFCRGDIICSFCCFPLYFLFLSILLFIRPQLSIYLSI